MPMCLGRKYADLLLPARGRVPNPRGHNRIQKRHHRPQLRSELLNLALLLRLPPRQKVRAAFFVLLDPCLGKTSIADPGQQLLHLFARFVRNNFRPSMIIALLRGVADGIPHIAQPTAIDQVHNQLQFVHAFEVRHFRLVPGIHQRLESCLDQFAHASAEHRLLAKQIRLGLFRKRGLQHARARGSQSLRVRQRKRLRVPRSILLHCDQRRCASAFHKNFPHPVTRRLRSNHADVHIFRWSNRAKANIEPMREHQRLPGLQVRLNFFPIQFPLPRVRRQNHDYIGPRRCFRRRLYDQPFFLRLRLRSAVRGKPDHHGHPRVPQIQSVRMPLRSITNDRHLLRLHQREIRILVVIKICHFHPFSGTDTPVCALRFLCVGVQHCFSLSFEGWAPCPQDLQISQSLLPARVPHAPALRVGRRFCSLSSRPEWLRSRRANVAAQRRDPSPTSPPLRPHPPPPAAATNPRPESSQFSPSATSPARQTAATLPTTHQSYPPFPKSPQSTTPAQHPRPVREKLPVIASNAACSLGPPKP